MSTIKHDKYTYIKMLIEAGIGVNLVGPAGSGKSTILMAIAEELGKEHFAVIGTGTSSESKFLGFYDANSTVRDNPTRSAVKTGGMLVIEEINGCAPDALLCLNTLDNGFLAPPDGKLQVADGFILCATMNPASGTFTGRRMQDGSVMDRLEEVEVPLDNSLEEKLTSKFSATIATKARELLRKNGVTAELGMRDVIRFDKKKDLKNLPESPLLALSKGNLTVFEDLQKFVDELLLAEKDVNDCKSLEEVQKVIDIRCKPTQPYN